MAIAADPWEMELYKNIINDIILLLQKYVVHSASVYISFLLCLLRPIHFWRLVHLTIQSHIHVDSINYKSYIWTRCKLCGEEKRIIIIRIYARHSKTKSWPCHKEAVTIFATRLRNKQIFIQAIPQNILHRPIELYIQLY
jgi:hypothetical protein